MWQSFFCIVMICTKRKFWEKLSNIHQGELKVIFKFCVICLWLIVSFSRSLLKWVLLCVVRIQSLGTNFKRNQGIIATRNGWSHLVQGRGKLLARRKILGDKSWGFEVFPQKWHTLKSNGCTCPFPSTLHTLFYFFCLRHRFQQSFEVKLVFMDQFQPISGKTT